MILEAQSLFLIIVLVVCVSRRMARNSFAKLDVDDLLSSFHSPCAASRHSPMLGR